MGKSFKKTPITGNTTVSSEKWDKRFANRKLRTAVRTKLKTITDDDDAILPEMKEVYDDWEMKKDGKGWFEWMKHEESFKDYYEKLMRK